MEQNASKALLMAAGVLIGIIMLSLGVYLVTSMRNFSRNYNDSLEAQKLEQFNSKFTVFQNRQNISIHEIITLVNIANEFNKTNNIENSNDKQYIHVIVDLDGTKRNTIDLTDEATYPKTVEYRNNPSKFISDLLDGIYIYNNVSKVEKEGQFQYDYIEDSNTKKKYKRYYNCFQYADCNINSNTGRIDTIIFKLLQHYDEEIGKKTNKK